MCGMCDVPSARCPLFETLLVAELYSCVCYRVPYHTIPIPLNADDKIILEQEWFFLASSSPYESHLYKTLNNSDEAMTTKTELFNPGKDCVGDVVCGSVVLL
jgi:hypothetical protein